MLDDQPQDQTQSPPVETRNDATIAFDTFNAMAGVESIQPAIQRLQARIIDRVRLHGKAVPSAQSWDGLLAEVIAMLSAAQESFAICAAYSTGFLAEAVLLIFAQMEKTIAAEIALADAAGGGN